MKLLTYKQLCKEFDLPYYSGGNQKKAQLEELKRYYNYEKQGNKYLIKEKYDKPLLKQRKGKYIKQFQIPFEYEKSAGIYAIKKDTCIYIGQTNNFFKRFQKHCIYNPLIQEGGIMYLLELEDNREQRLFKETKWSYYYLNQGYTLCNSFKLLKKEKKEKIKFMKIFVNVNQYETACKILKDNGVDILK